VWSTFAAKVDCALRERAFRAPPSSRCGVEGLLGRQSGSALFDDEHVTKPITVGVSRSKHSGEPAMHVKHVLADVLVAHRFVLRTCVSRAEAPTDRAWSRQRTAPIFS
jgi:hypothetical protein